MKKKICSLLLIIGIFLICLGLFLFKNVVYDKNTDVVDVKEIKVDTSVIVGDNIDNSLYSYYVKNNLIKITSKDFNIERGNIYEIKIPGDLVQAYLNDYGKFFSSDNINVEVYSDLSFDVDNFINKSVEDYNSYGYSMVNYSSNKNIKCDNYSCGYVKFMAKRDDATPYDVEGYTEKFVFFVKVDNSFSIYSFEFIDMKVSDEFLTEIINSFNIDSGKAKYTYTTMDDDLIYGEIRQIKVNSKYGYKVNYTLPSSKYSEIETIDNNIYVNNFMDNSNLFNIKLISVSTDVVKYIDDSNRNLFKNYEEVFHKSEEIMHQGKKYLAVKSLYTKGQIDKNIYLYNFIYEIEENFALSITITANNEFDTDKFMKEFNFKVEKQDNFSLNSNKSY